MLNVNNKKVIARLASKTYKANKLRNLFAIVAIILTTLLFTSVFTVGMNLVKSLEQETMRQVGGSFHAGLKQLTQEQYDKMRTHPSIKEIGYTVVLGFGANKELSSRQVEIRYASDQRQAEQMFSKPTVGRMPTAYNEIATDTLTLDLLGIPYELGQKITLQYNLNEELRSETFTLVGYWQGDRIMVASQAWLSPEYVTSQLENLDPLKNNQIIGTINANVNFFNSRSIEDKVEKVVTDSGYPINEISIGVNWAYLGAKTYDIATLLGAFGGLLLIVFCGYLIISNIFLISVSRDIRFYGLLKTIGTTGKQLRTLIHRQAFYLCVVGIPMGLLLGYYVGVSLTPAVMSILTINRVSVSASPVIFVGSAVFALFTVFVSTVKAAKLAGKVSPIEALRSSETVNMKKTTRKSGGVNIAKMGIANVFRSRKKAILVTISLSLSLIILNTTVSIVNGFDMEKYISNQIDCDFLLSDMSRGNFTTDFYNRTVPESVLSDVAAQSGIQAMSNVYFSEQMYPIDEQLRNVTMQAKAILDEIWKERAVDVQRSIDDGSTVSHLYGIDEYGLDKLNLFGEVDRTKFLSGEYVIASPLFTDGRLPSYNIGDTVTLNLGNGRSKEYTVLAIGLVPYHISAQHSHPAGVDFILPSDEYIRQMPDALPMVTMLDVAPEMEPSMEAFLTDYAKVNKDIKYKSKATVIKEFENLQKTYLLVGGILSAIIAFIGIMNFINTMITSVIARRRELAMLQSIGMTGKQLIRLLISEGLTYTALSAIFTLTLGSVLGYGLVNLVAGGMYIFTASFTVIPALLCLPVLGVFAFIVPLICYKTTSRDSIVERLREVE